MTDPPYPDKQPADPSPTLRGITVAEHRRHAVLADRLHAHALTAPEAKELAELLARLQRAAESSPSTKAYGALYRETASRLGVFRLQRGMA